MTRPQRARRRRRVRAQRSGSTRRHSWWMRGPRVKSLGCGTRSSRTSRRRSRSYTRTRHTRRCGRPSRARHSARTSSARRASRLSRPSWVPCSPSTHRLTLRSRSSTTRSTPSASRQTRRQRVPRRRMTLARASRRAQALWATWTGGQRHAGRASSHCARRWIRSSRSSANGCGWTRATHPSRALRPSSPLSKWPPSLLATRRRRMSVRGAPRQGRRRR